MQGQGRRTILNTLLSGVCRLDTHQRTRRVYCNGLCVTLSTELLLASLTSTQHGVLDDLKFKSFPISKTAPFHTNINSHPLSFSRSTLMYDYNLRAEAVSLRLYLSSSGQQPTPSPNSLMICDAAVFHCLFLACIWQEELLELQRQGLTRITTEQRWRWI